MLEDKRTTLAIFLCIIVVMFYTEMVITPQARQAQQQKIIEMQRRALEEDRARAAAGTGLAPAQTLGSGLVANGGSGQAGTSTALGAPQQQVIPAVSPAVAPANAANVVPTSVEIANSPQTIIQLPDREIVFTNLGARIQSYKLLGHRAELGENRPLDLVVPSDEAPLPLGVYFTDGNDALVKYELVEVQGATKSNEGEYSSVPDGDARFVFKGPIADGGFIKKEVIFPANSALMNVNVNRYTADGNLYQSTVPAWLEWASYVPNIESGNTYNHELITALLVSDKLLRVEPTEIRDSRVGTLPVSDGVWIGVGDKYFGAAIIPTTQSQNIRYGRNRSTLSVQARGVEAGGEFKLFAGAKDYDRLTAQGFSLERFIDLGWFSFLAYPLLWAIKFFYQLLGNYGLAIIALTLVIKAAFLPLTKVSFKSMKAMQEIQPEMKALQERIKDRNQLNQELMALYKRRGVNPMGGCLPILIQIPVFLGLYNALLNSIEMRHSPFALWIQDLSVPEYLDVFGVPLPIMVLLMGASMFWQTYTTPSPADPMQRKVMLFMPVVFTLMFVIYPFPAGLVLYWLVNNIISIVQQISIRSDDGLTPGKATAIASVAVFAVGYVLTLI